MLFIRAIRSITNSLPEFFRLLQGIVKEEIEHAVAESSIFHGDYNEPLWLSHEINVMAQRGQKAQAFRTHAIDVHSIEHPGLSGREIM